METRKEAFVAGENGMSKQALLQTETTTPEHDMRRASLTEDVPTIET